MEGRRVQTSRLLWFPSPFPFFLGFFLLISPLSSTKYSAFLHQRLLTLKRVLLFSTKDNNHSTLHFYHHHLPNLSHASITQQRLQLFNSFNGDAFYPLSVWPQEFKLIFWKKQISDKDTFKLFLFLIGNGCSPHLISHWILTYHNTWLQTKRPKNVLFN